MFKRMTSALSLAVLLPLACCNEPVPATSPTRSEAPDAEQRNKEIVRAAFARWAAGGTDFFNELLAQDVLWTIEGSGPSAGVYRGRQDFIDRAVAPFAARLSRPVRPDVKQIWAEGDHVVVHWDGEATAGDGRPYSNSYVWIFRMRGEKAAEVTAFLDLVPYDDVLRRVPLPS